MQFFQDLNHYSYNPYIDNSHCTLHRPESTHSISLNKMISYNDNLCDERAVLPIHHHWNHHRHHSQSQCLYYWCCLMRRRMMGTMKERLMTVWRTVSSL